MIKTLFDRLMMASNITVFKNPIYTPSKHTKQSYAAQMRAAKKRRNIKARRRK